MYESSRAAANAIAGWKYIFVLLSRPSEVIEAEKKQIILELDKIGRTIGDVRLLMTFASQMMNQQDPDRQSDENAIRFSTDKTNESDQSYSLSMIDNLQLQAFAKSILSSKAEPSADDQSSTGGPLGDGRASTGAVISTFILLLLGKAGLNFTIDYFNGESIIDQLAIHESLNDLQVSDVILETSVQEVPDQTNNAPTTAESPRSSKHQTRSMNSVNDQLQRIYDIAEQRQSMPSQLRMSRSKNRQQYLDSLQEVIKEEKQLENEHKTKEIKASEQKDAEYQKDVQSEGTARALWNFYARSENLALGITGLMAIVMGVLLTLESRRGKKEERERPTPQQQNLIDRLDEMIGVMPKTEGITLTGQDVFESAGLISMVVKLYVDTLGLTYYIPLIGLIWHIWSELTFRPKFAQQLTNSIPSESAFAGVGNFNIPYLSEWFPELNATFGQYTSIASLAVRSFALEAIDITVASPERLLEFTTTWATPILFFGGLHVASVWLRVPLLSAITPDPKLGDAMTKNRNKSSIRQKHEKFIVFNKNQALILSKVDIVCQTLIRLLDKNETKTRLGKFFMVLEQGIREQQHLLLPQDGGSEALISSDQTATSLQQSIQREIQLTVREAVVKMQQDIRSWMLNVDEFHRSTLNLLDSDDDEERNRKYGQLSADLSTNGSQLVAEIEDILEAGDQYLENTEVPLQQTLTYMLPNVQYQNSLTQYTAGAVARIAQVEEDASASRREPPQIAFSDDQEEKHPDYRPLPSQDAGSQNMDASNGIVNSLVSRFGSMMFGQPQYDTDDDDEKQSQPVKQERMSSRQQFPNRTEAEHIKAEEVDAIHEIHSQAIQAELAKEAEIERRITLLVAEQIKQDQLKREKKQ